MNNDTYKSLTRNTAKAHSGKNLLSCSVVQHSRLLWGLLKATAYWCTHTFADHSRYKYILVTVEISRDLTASLPQSASSPASTWVLPKWIFSTGSLRPSQFTILGSSWRPQFARVSLAYIQYIQCLVKREGGLGFPPNKNLIRIKNLYLTLKLRPKNWASRSINRLDKQGTPFARPCSIWLLPECNCN